jgi:hypothetical protein
MPRHEVALMVMVMVMVMVMAAMRACREQRAVASARPGE